MGQLLSAVGDETYTYTYDSAGNVLTANGHTYTYGAPGWPDLLSGYDGETIVFDRIGNPLSYYNGTRWTFTWKNGRSLATATDGDTSLSFGYDAGGLRTTKTVDGVAHKYYYAGGQLMRETYGNRTLDFFYDAEGNPYGLKTNEGFFLYITNLQGDVTHLINVAGNIVASYEYDPYGNIVSATGTMADINPLRYRGYYYDTELEMYYLQSRYYDPQIGRFLNMDDVHFEATSDTVVCLNLFAYCVNSPCNYVDANGNWAERYLGFKRTGVGFNVYYSSSFMSKAVCMAYASNIISLYGGWSWWYGFSYKNMNTTRIAKELFAHAVLFNIGIGAMKASISHWILNELISTLSGPYSLKSLSTINQKISYLEHELGFYLFNHSRYIEVNNNEKWYRIIAFNVIWSLF